MLYFPDHADVAQLVEHHLAKVRVAGSNPVVRSGRRPLLRQGFPAFQTQARDQIWAFGLCPPVPSLTCTYAIVPLTFVPRIVPRHFGHSVCSGRARGIRGQPYGPPPPSSSEPPSATTAWVTTSGRDAHCTLNLVRSGETGLGALCALTELVPVLRIVHDDSVGLALRLLAHSSDVVSLAG